MNIIKITEEKLNLFLYITARYADAEDQLRELVKSGFTLEEMLEIALSVGE